MRMLTEAWSETNESAREMGLFFSNACKGSYMTETFCTMVYIGFWSWGSTTASGGLAIFISNRAIKFGLTVDGKSQPQSHVLVTS